VSGCIPLSNTVMEHRLRFFGHSALCAPNEDHHPAVAAAIYKPPFHWKVETTSQLDPVAHGSESLSLIWDHST